MHKNNFYHDPVLFVENIYIICRSRNDIWMTSIDLFESNEQYDAYKTLSWTIYELLHTCNFTKVFKYCVHHTNKQKYISSRAKYKNYTR